MGQFAGDAAASQSDAAFRGRLDGGRSRGGPPPAAASGAGSVRRGEDRWGWAQRQALQIAPLPSGDVIVRAHRWIASTSGIALGVVLFAQASTIAADPETSSSASSDQTASSSAPSSEQPYDARTAWQQVQDAMARGAYAEALQVLDRLAEHVPHDPWVAAYRTLCQRRLDERAHVPQFSPDQKAALERALKDEEQAQRRAAVETKTLERQIRKEQEAWDRQLKDIQQQSLRDQRAKRRQPPTPIRPSSTVPSGGAPAPSMTASGAGVSPSQPAATPITGETQPPPSPPAAAGETQPTSAPALVEPLPPRVYPNPSDVPEGAYQIFADQMSVVQERQLAVATGNVHVVFHDGVLTCDRATVFTDTNDVYATGQVRLQQGSSVFRGELVHYNTKTKKGRFLEGTAGEAPWYEHGRVVEHLTQDVLRVRAGYLTSCDLEPPHYRFQSRSATVFTGEQIARGQHVTLTVEEFPLIYLPWLSAADRQSPFFLIPGKNKIWEEFALGGYRYEWPEGQKGTLHMDWRRTMLWGFGLDHQFNTEALGKGLLKLYYNDEPNIRRPKSDWVKGAAIRRYRVLWRHDWRPTPNINVLTDIQKFSDEDFRKEFLFREEFAEESSPESFVSMVANDPNFSLTALAKRRMNRFQTVTEALPDAKFDLRTQPLGDSGFFSNTSLNAANLQTKNAHSEIDTDEVRVGWSQGLSYALNLLQPVQITPNFTVKQTYYNKDKQGGAERPDGQRNLIAGQASMGTDASLKLFKMFPVATNWLGLNINGLRHVVTPTASYQYIHRPTILNEQLSFGQADSPTNQLTLGLENKLQTKRKGKLGRPSQSVDVARLITSVPYTYRGIANKQGGRFGDWPVTLELYPWPWLRLETSTVYPSHFVKGSRDERIATWNTDLIIVGGSGQPQAQQATDIQAPQSRSYQPGPQMDVVTSLLPVGQWYLGLGHRYSENDKTETVCQFDWRVSPKWQISTFHRLTWKEVAGGSKRFNNMREYQYVLTRDLHDWLAEFVYRVDREFGEELFFTLTLKAYPVMPLRLADSYHEPKAGSQSSPFSPVPHQ